jgi:hypothetical protein
MATVVSEESPPPPPPLLAIHQLNSVAPMVFQRVDLEPFILEHLQYEDIPNREFMEYAVAPVQNPLLFLAILIK